MVKVGITGQSGFVGTHLFNELGEYPEKYVRIPFEDCYFDDENKLRAFVKQCDVIVHLAAMMRSPIPGEVYRTNLQLVKKLISAMNAENVKPSVLFSSSIQENNGSEYGRCKQEGREMLENWARIQSTGFIGLIFPNLFGPGARPNSHSFIATFCDKLNHDEEPQVLVDNVIPLKYIKTLMKELLDIILDVSVNRHINTVFIKPEFKIRVTEVLEILLKFKNGVKPQCYIEELLYKTYISYRQ